jgi:hypothetical protein
MDRPMSYGIPVDAVAIGRAKRARHRKHDIARLRDGSTDSAFTRALRGLVLPRCAGLPDT